MKYIIQTIRVSVVLVVSMLVFAGDVLAAPELLPTSVVDITENSAVIREYVQNYGESSVVWFEWSEASSSVAPVIIAMNNYFGSGFFTAQLTNLTPGATYSFRAAVKWKGQTFYSPVSSFIATGGPTSSLKSASQTPLGTGVISGAVVKQNITTTKKNTNVVSSVKSATIKPPSIKNTAEGNVNIASVAGAGGNILPTTLIGWVATFVSVLVAVLIIVMIFESTERRKKLALETVKKEEMKH